MVLDRYSEAVIDLRETIMSYRLLRLTFRAYNERVAFRYALPEQDGLDTFVITSEFSWFRLPEGAIGCATHSTQGSDEKVPMEEIWAGCERPPTAECADGVFAFI
jgi:alpha-glucosidase